jgi:hypothetical protein
MLCLYELIDFSACRNESLDKVRSVPGCTRLIRLVSKASQVQKHRLRHSSRTHYAAFDVLWPCFCRHAYKSCIVNYLETV